MLVVLIVIPAIVVAVAVVVVLDRLGVLPRLEGGSSFSSSGWGSSGGSGFLASIPMAVWILAWLLFLVIGLSVLAG
jgi:hypothetical protein